MPLDFTLDKYKELCDAFSRYKILTVADYLSNRPSEGFVILRHDVDRMPRNALRMATFECKLGIASTYYFRYTRGAFQRDIIRAISDMGHEVGYHYETLSKANGVHEEAMSLFRFELGEFRKICEVETVSMHGSPLSKYVNDEIWKNSSFDEFDLLGDGSLSIFGMPYITDAGRSWDNRNNIRDSIRAAEFLNDKVRATDDLIKILTSRSYSRLYLNIHPERWAQSKAEWLMSALLDAAMNSGKKFVRFILGS